MNERELFKKTFDSLPVPEGLDQRAIENTQAVRRAPSRMMRVAVFAAVIVALLSACAVAAQMITNKPDLVTQCNLELDTLRELGLFTAEFEVTMEDKVPDFEAEHVNYQRPELSEDKYEGVISLRGYDWAEHLYSYDMDIDTDTGKITGLLINASPQEDWVPYAVGFWGDPGNSAMGFYDNPDAIFDPGLTLGQMCAALAQYQGYERWELPMDATEDVRFIDAPELEAWNIGYSGPDGLTVAFYRSGKKEPEYYAFNYTPSAAGPYFTVRPAEGPYVPEEHTYSPRMEFFAEDDERSAVKLINTQLDELRTLGLLRSGLEVTWQDDHSNITAGRISEEYKGKVYFTGGRQHDDCNYSLCYDAGTGKLDCLSICSKPADGSARVADVYDAGFGAVIDEGLTIGEYCELWARYQGYERWELPEGVDEATRYLDAHTLDAWEDGIVRGSGENEYYNNGLVISFFRPGSDGPEYGYVRYGPSDIGPCVTIGSDYLFEHRFAN